MQHKLSLKMGDVNYLCHVNSKIRVLEKELIELQGSCNFLRNFLNDYECTTDKEILVLNEMVAICDMRIACIKRLQQLMLSRWNFLNHN